MSRRHNQNLENAREKNTKMQDRAKKASANEIALAKRKNFADAAREIVDFALPKRKNDV